MQRRRRGVKAHVGRHRARVEVGEDRLVGDLVNEAPKTPIFFEFHRPSVRGSRQRNSWPAGTCTCSQTTKECHQPDHFTDADGDEQDAAHHADDPGVST